VDHVPVVATTDAVANTVVPSLIVTEPPPGLADTEPLTVAPVPKVTAEIELIESVVLIA
jgi:hypothetical protein